MQSHWLDIQNIHQVFELPQGIFQKPKKVHALNGVSLQMKQGEILGVVGESGCGKSTLARTLMRLQCPSQGQILLKGRDIESYPRQQYYQQLQMVFQDPYSSLNPKMSVGAILQEMIMLHRPTESPSQIVHELLDAVGLPKQAQFQYPHEFSGGQRQRIAIARALCSQPECVIADEPVSALDISIQSQILNLLKKLQIQYKLSLVFITHDLSLVPYFCDRVLVMKEGSIVEEQKASSLMDNASHPYTKSLLAHMPSALRNID